MKSVIFVIPCLHGGGAERVAMMLTNEFQRNGYETTFILTHDKPEDVVQNELSEQIRLVFLQDNVKRTCLKKIIYKCVEVISRILCGITEKLKLCVPAWMAYMSFIWQYYGEIEALRKILIDNPQSSVISFLQPSIPITLLAARGLPNNVVISERGDPQRLMKNRYGGDFLKKYYERADHIVFQTEDAKNTYPNSLSNKGVIIFNPIKSNLPEPYTGKRNKTISTFCRITKQKNLPLLIESFALFYCEHPDYELHIIGDTQNEADEELLAQLKEQVGKLNICEAVKWIPFTNNVHEMILKDAMYVNSSDYEGMSNAMLEAMAIGLPVICTDCPIGGASAIIIDHYNGILTPVGDRDALVKAMKEIIENTQLADELSRNATKFRAELEVNKIVSQWMGLL